MPFFSQVVGVLKAWCPHTQAQGLISDEEEGLVRRLEGHIRFRLHAILQAQEDLQEPQSAGGLVGDGDASPMELCNGLGGEQEQASSLFDTGDAKTRYRLEAIFQAEGVRQ